MNGVWLERENVNDISVGFDIGEVPVIGKGTLLEAIKFVKDGFPSQWGDFQAEGLVLRPVIELQTRRSERVITKVKCKDFV